MKALIALLLLTGSASAATIPLVVSDYQAFQELGRSCGGIKKYGSATGFENGSPTGMIRLETTCSSGGRGSHPTTYMTYVSVTWDLSGNVISISKTLPIVTNPVFTFDGYTESTNLGYYPSLNYGYSALTTP